MAEIKVAVIESEVRPTVVVARETSWTAFPSLWASLLDQVYAVVTPPEASSESFGAERWQNIMLYKDNVPNVEVGVLASGPVACRGEVVASVLPAGMTATATHRGPYAALALTHRAIRVWCARHGRQIAGPRWEIYGHWREDPSELETEIHYLLD